jgi:hypothetical protein
MLRMKKRALVSWRAAVKAVVVAATEVASIVG